jgi:imidazole glycerol-phosphate synthase subunit HisH
LEIAIVDYGSGNVRSVYRALQKAAGDTATVEITNSAQKIRDAAAVVFPGQGAAGQCMGNLRASGLSDTIIERIKSGKAFMGVCVGLQLLFSHMEENDTIGLDIIEGDIPKFPSDSGLKVPEMGWNRVKQVRPSPLWENVPDESYFYFVHSYYPAPAPSAGSLIIGTTDYGIDYCSAVGKDNFFGVQFHPEKSGQIGLKVYANFLRFAQKC